MTENKGSDKTIRNGHCWHIAHCTRSGRIFWGIFFVVAGMIWLAQKTGWLPLELADIFWPAVFIIMGIRMMAVSLIRKV